jgi:zinc/manganese transport system substrate-binding protein
MTFGNLSLAGVTTSFPVLTLIVHELVGPEIEVSTLTQSGEQAHHFEVTPKTLMHLQKQDLLIVNGLGFEHWLDQLEKNKLLKGKIIVATRGVTPLKDLSHKLDPHAWHDPENLVLYINNIHTALVSQYPNQKVALDLKLKTLNEKILTWKKQKEIQFAQLPKSFCIITAHSAFSYLARAFGFKSIALLGDHEGETLSPRQLTLKINELKTQPERAFFGDGTKQDTILKEWARKTSSPWGGVLIGDSLEQAPKNLTLMDYLEHNVSIITKAPQH